MLRGETASRALLPEGNEQAPKNSRGTHQKKKIIRSDVIKKRGRTSALRVTMRVAGGEDSSRSETHENGKIWGKSQLRRLKGA